MARNKNTVTYVSPLSVGVALQLLSNDLPIPTNLWNPVTVPPIRAGGSDGKSSDPPASTEPKNSTPRFPQLGSLPSPPIRFQVQYPPFRPEPHGNWQTWETEDLPDLFSDKRSPFVPSIRAGAGDGKSPTKKLNPDGGEPVDEITPALLSSTWSKASTAQLETPAPTPSSFELDPQLLAPAASTSIDASASRKAQPSIAEKEDDASAQDASHIRIPGLASAAAQIHGVQNLVYGLSRSIDLATPLDDFLSFEFSKPPAPVPWDPKTLENLPNADSSEEEPPIPRHLSLDAIITDDVADEEDLDDAWFAKFPTHKELLAPLGPLYAQHPNRGTMPEEKAEESKIKSDDGNESENEQEKKEEKEDKKKYVSPLFGCIIIANGAPLVPYPLDTVNALGNIPMSRYSTTIRIYDRMFEFPELVITINICYGKNNVEFASISLPLDTVTTKPKASTLDAKQLSTLLSYRGLPAEPPNGAFVQEVVFDNEETDVRFNRRALSDLQSLNMPRLGALQTKITNLFTSRCLNLTMLVTEEWKDFATWSEEFQRLFNESLSDPKETLKTRAKGQPITIRNYVPKLPEAARKLPARMKFRDVEDAITSLGDGAAREHATEKWASKEISNIQCHALMMPIGTQTCMLRNKDGELVAVPYLFSFSIVKTSNDKLFAQLAPAINTSTKIQVQIGYRKVKPPTHGKSPGEMVLMIGRAMHNQLWDCRPPIRVSKDKMNQAWVDAYATIIKPYINVEAFGKDGGDDIIQGYAYMLSQELQKVRADKDRDIKSETPKEHKQRTIAAVNRDRTHLQLPPDTNADIPEFTAVRMVHDDPLDKISDHQFVAFRPKQMRWPKDNLELGLAPAPFLDFAQPRLPPHGNYDQLANWMNTTDSKKVAKYLVPVRFVKVGDDATANSKTQGLLKMKEFQDTAVVKWYSDFKGNPIQTNVTNTFSVLKQAMHHHHYDAALPFREDSEEVIKDKWAPPIRRKDGKVMEYTTKRFQKREAKVVKWLCQALDSFSEDQQQVMIKLTKAPFGTLEIQGVPGSGKTTVAHKVFTGCMYSSIDPKLVTFRDPGHAKIVDSDSEFEPDEDGKYHDIKPVLPNQPPPQQDDEAAEKKDDGPPTSIDCYDIPHLAFGPSRAEYEDLLGILTAAAPGSVDEYCTQLFTALHTIYCCNFDKTYPPTEATARVRDSHWNTWFASAMAAMTRGSEASVDIDPPRDEDKKDEPATIADILKEIAAGNKNEPPLPPDRACNPQAMIIANQHANGDDAARLMDGILNEELHFDELIIRVTNLQLEQKALKRSCRPLQQDEVHTLPGLTDLVELGIQPDKLDAFVNRTGDFARNKHGGVWRLENIMQQRLKDGHEPALLRELQRLSNPADIMTVEQKQSLDKSINEFMKEILSEAGVVICTFAVAQSLVHKKLYDPTVVLIDEASREPELLVRWAQTALNYHLLMLVGDYRQDEPFVNGRYSKIPDHKNIHVNQILTPLSRRLMTVRPEYAVFLSENRRQHGDLQGISSDISYEGNMRSVFDPRYPSRLAYSWWTFAQQLVLDHRSLKNDKDLAKGVVAENLTGNRVTILCNSPATKRGLSSVNPQQARIAVETAAKIHQSHIPGSDMIHRPTICIITPYSAQVDEIKTKLRTMSSKELCHDRIEVRTQTSSTGGEWDVTILCFVRDTGMGFLSESNRINVMLTRPKYLSVDIMDENFYRKPSGHNAKIIRRYADTQALNGAQCKDPRNWYQVCRRCYTPHEKECRGTLKCFFCEKKGHHARNCTAPGSLDPTINPNVMDIPTV